jgi:hypothetical protein
LCKTEAGLVFAGQREHVLRQGACSRHHGDSAPLVALPRAQRQAMIGSATKCLEWVASGQATFYKVRQLMARQRQHLLAHDELSMCSARFSLHGEHTCTNAMRAQLFLHTVEVRHGSNSQWLTPVRHAAGRALFGVLFC